MIETPTAGERLSQLRERELIEKSQRGDRDSAHALINAYQNRLHAFVWRMVRNNHDAEEICQDTFLRAFQALDGFDFTYRFSTWLFTIGYRLCLNSMRRRRDYVGDVDFSRIMPSGDGADDDVSDGIANTAEAARLKDVIWGSVEALTPPQKATVLLFYRESMSCQEIGEVLGMPAATVKSHLHRARNRLRELLSTEFAEDWTSVRFDQAESA